MYRRLRRSADVDAAVLAARVRIVAERERAQDRPFDGPVPARRGRRLHQRGRSQHRYPSPHSTTSSLSDRKTEVAE
jgi:hypothetical protein